MEDDSLTRDDRVFRFAVPSGFVVEGDQWVNLYGPPGDEPTEFPRWLGHSQDMVEAEGAANIGLIEAGSWFRSEFPHRRGTAWPRTRPGPRYVPVNEGRLRRLDEAVGELRQTIAELRNTVGELTEALHARPLVLSTEIVDLSSRDYLVRHPIPIVIEESEEETVASFPETETFGAGGTASEAIGELKKQIIWLYEDLATSDPDEFGKLPAAWWRILQHYVSRQ
jgi:hypothetical protein